MADSTEVQTFCGECGTRVRPGAAFCFSCGELLSTPQQNGVSKAESSSSASPMASQVIDGRPRAQEKTVTDRPAANTAGADEEQSGASYWSPIAASGRSGGGSGFDLSDPVGSFLEAVRGVVLQPSSFFSALPRGGDFLSPLLFAVICYEVMVILSGLIGLASGTQGFGAFLGTVILAPVAIAAGLAIGAGILHLLVLVIVKPVDTGYEATFRAGSYAAVTGLVNWIPFVGPILGLYSLYLTIVGIRELHATTTSRAALVVLIPAGVVLVLSLLVAIVVWIVLIRALGL